MEIFTTLKHLASTGVALLLVEQYVARALEMADHVVLLDRGRVAFAGACSELEQDAVEFADASPEPPPEELYTDVMIGDANAIAWRYHRCRPCRHCAQSLCRACTTDWDQADRYHALALTLGAVGDHPSVVSRCSASSRTGSWSRASTSPS